MYVSEKIRMAEISVTVILLSLGMIQGVIGGSVGDTIIAAETGKSQIASKNLH